MIKENFISTARSVSDLKCHLVLTTKYRKKVFDRKMIERLETIFKKLLEENWSCRMIEFNGESDHLHILIQYNPQIQLSKLVNNLKTVSSRYLRKEFNSFGKNALWNGSYFIASCGGVTIEQLKRYVQNQDTPTQ